MRGSRRADEAVAAEPDREQYQFLPAQVVNPGAKSARLYSGDCGQSVRATRVGAEELNRWPTVQMTVPEKNRPPARASPPERPSNAPSGSVLRRQRLGQVSAANPSQLVRQGRGNRPRDPLVAKTESIFGREPLTGSEARLIWTPLRSHLYLNGRYPRNS